MNRKHCGSFLLFILPVIWTNDARTETLVSGLIRGVSVEEIVSLDRGIRFDAMNRLIEACGGTLSVGERNWNDGLWRPSLKDGFSVSDEAGWNWDWKPLQMNPDEIAKLLQLAKAYKPQPDLRGLSVDDKKLIVYAQRGDWGNWAPIGHELCCRILARIPDKDVLSYLLIHLDEFSYMMPFSGTSIPREWIFSFEIQGKMNNYQWWVKGEPYMDINDSGVGYAILLSQAYLLSDILDVIAAHYDRMYGKWSGMTDVLPEKTVRQFLAYLLVGKAMAETPSSDDTERTTAIQSLLTSAKFNSNLPFAQQAEAIREMAVGFAARKPFQ